MNKSENILNLMNALSLFQGEVHDIVKDSTGYGYRYASLSGVLEIIRPLCAKYNLAVMQLCHNDCTNPGVMGIETVISHKSGEYISSTFYMTIEPKKGMSLCQSAGSAVTYMRRYALCAALNLTQTDDDASLKTEAKKEISLYDTFVALVKEKNIGKEEALEWCQQYDVARLGDLSNEQLNELLVILGGRK